MRPIQVYLDSSDFSDLANIRSKPPEYEKVRQYLLKMRDVGLINMCFSEAHVIEAAPTSVGAIPAASERFRSIKELCGKNCLMHPVDLMTREVSQEALAVSRQPSVLRGDGSWMPRLFDIEDIVPNVEQLVREDVQKRGRAEQRKYLKNGRPTAKWYSEMREANVGMGNFVSNELPLSAGALRTVKRYFTGDASRDEALMALRDSLADLEVFGQWYTKSWSDAVAMSGHLRDTGAQFQAALGEGRKEFENLIATNTAAGHDEKRLLLLSMQSFYEVLAGSSASLSKAMAVQMGALAKPVDDPWRAAPGLTCSITLALHVARRSVASSPPRAPKRSDFADSYHALYLPYVDIFRTDGFMANMLAECKLPVATVVVEKFLQLPAVIDRLLEERNLKGC